MNAPSLVLGVLLIAASCALMFKFGRGWLILAAAGLLKVIDAFGPPQWLAELSQIIFWSLTVFGLLRLFVGHADKARRSFRTIITTMTALLGLTAILGIGLSIIAMGTSASGVAGQAQVQAEAPATPAPAGAGDHATVTLAVATASCRADAVGSYLHGQGFKASDVTIGVSELNHNLSELTATGSAHFGAASTTRKGLQKYLDSGSAAARANRDMLREKFPHIPAQTLFDADNWEVFQSSQPMSIEGNHGWENGKAVDLGTRASAAGDAVWLYVDPVTCKVPAATPTFENAAMVVRSDNGPSVRPVGVVRVGCSNPGNNVTPGHHSTPVPQKPAKPTHHKPAPTHHAPKPSPTPTHHKPTPSQPVPTHTPIPSSTPVITPTPTGTPTPSPTPSQPTSTPTPTESTPTPTPTPTATTPAPCEYDSHLPANSPDCKPAPKPCIYNPSLPASSPECVPPVCIYNKQLPANSPECVKPTPTPTPTPTESTPTPTPTPTPSCEYGVNDEGHCKKSDNPGDYAQPGNGGKGQDVGEGTKPPVTADPTPESTPKPVKTEQTGGGGVVDTPTKAPGSETGGTAPGAAPAPSTPRPIPSDEGGPATNSGSSHDLGTGPSGSGGTGHGSDSSSSGSDSGSSSSAPTHSSEPSSEPSHSEPAPNPVHTDPVPQPTSTDW